MPYSGVEGSPSGLWRRLVTLRVIPRRGRKVIMYYVYVLKSQMKDWIYIGTSKDLKARYVKHNAGMVRSTKFYKPFDLVYYEAYKTNSLAHNREVELKMHNQQKEILFKRLGL
jgi:putative endonuclease